MRSCLNSIVVDLGSPVELMIRKYCMTRVLIKSLRCEKENLKPCVLKRKVTTASEKSSNLETLEICYAAFLVSLLLINHSDLLLSEIKSLWNPW